MVSPALAEIISSLEEKNRRLHGMFCLLSEYRYVLCHDFIVVNILFIFVVQLQQQQPSHEISLQSSLEDIVIPVKRLRGDASDFGPLFDNDEPVMQIAAEDNELVVPELSSHLTFDVLQSSAQESPSSPDSSSSNEEDSQNLTLCCICESAEKWISTSGARRNEALVRISAAQS